MTEPPLPREVPERTLDAALGFELLEWGDERARGRFPVEDRVRQAYGIVHGGAYAALAEWVVSVATAAAVHDDGMLAMGQGNQTSFLRPVSSGTITADARRRHRGRTSWVWDVDFTDDQGRLCAVTRVTMAVRPAPTSQAP
ncbi:MAG: PaaI family thioesterase [Thermoleophilaceae bacterium]